MYEDDLTIGDEEPLWRRVPPIADTQVIFDPNLGRWRPSSAAFNDSSDGTPMSVTLGGDATHAGVTPESYLTNFSGFCLVTLSAGFVREIGQAVSRFPTKQDPHHAFVAGNKSGSVKNKMAKSATWVVFSEPPTTGI